MLKLKSVNFEQQQFQIHQLAQSYSGQLEWIIGRSSTCDLVLRSSEISRIHGRILYADDHYHFIDVGSTSGSLLNGEIVPVNDKRSLHPGDLLQIGETFLFIEDVSPPSPVSFIPSLIPSDVFPLMGRQWTEGDLVCRCCRIVDETPDVKTFCFTADPPVLFSYKPGQFVNLEVEIEGKTVMRSYSISSSPSRPWHFSLTIKRVPSPPDQPELPPGLVSNWLHDHLKVGDRVKCIGGPLGHFTCLPDLPPKILLISAGSGITPMMSMSRWLHDTLSECDIIFLHSARTPEDIVFYSELQAMAAQMPNFHLAVTITQPLGRPWMGLTGRISQSMLQLVAPDLLDRAVYVCGPSGFMQGIKSTLTAMNFPMERYQEESFGGKKPGVSISKSKSSNQAESVLTADSNVANHGTTNRHSDNNNSGNNGNGHNFDVPSPSSLNTEVIPAVHFSHSNCEIEADGSTPILELAEQEGIQIRHACRVGACGACKILAREGNVQYDTPPAALTPADKDAGYVLACVAYPIDRLVVEA